MKQAKEYEITLKSMEGIPVIWNVMKSDIEEDRRKAKKDELAEFERTSWRRKAEYNNKGEVVIPERWVKSALLIACKQTRLLPNFHTSKKETYTRYMQNIMIFGINNVVCKEKDLEEFSALVPSQPGSGRGGKVVRYWPRVKSWKVSFKIVDPFGRTKLSEFKELFEYAGYYLGLGDQRNQGNGRFEIEKILEVKE